MIALALSLLLAADPMLPPATGPSGRGVFAPVEDDAPRMISVDAGDPAPEPGFFLNDLGYARLSLETAKIQESEGRLRVENASLKHSLEQLQAEPTLNPITVTVIAIVAITVGGLVGWEIHR